MRSVGHYGCREQPVGGSLLAVTTTRVQTAGPQSDTLEVSRSLAASLAPGRHGLLSRRLEREYGEAPLTPSVRTRIASELDFCGLVILSEPWSEPLVVVKRSDQPSVGRARER